MVVCVPHCVAALAFLCVFRACIDPTGLQHPLTGVEHCQALEQALTSVEHCWQANEVSVFTWSIGEAKHLQLSIETRTRTHVNDAHGLLLMSFFTNHSSCRIGSIKSACFTLKCFNKLYLWVKPTVFIWYKIYF